MADLRQANDRELLLGLGPDDWAYLSERGARLKRVWAKALGVHVSAVTFNDKFGRLLGAKLAHLPRPATGFILATLKAHLHLELAHANDEEAFRASLPARLAAILDLPSGRFPRPEMFVHDCDEMACAAAGLSQADAAPPEEAGDDSDAESETAPRVRTEGTERPEGQECDEVAPGSLADVTRAIDELEALLPEVRECVDRMTADLEQRRRPAGSLDPLGSWYDGWSCLPGHLKTLEAARGYVELESNRVKALDADRWLLGAVCGLSSADGDRRAMGVLERVQRDVEQWPVPLDDAQRRSLQALLRVLAEGWGSDEDNETLAEHFGGSLLMAAGRLAPLDVPSSPMAAPAFAQLVASEPGEDVEDAGEPQAPSDPPADDEGLTPDAAEPPRQPQPEADLPEVPAEDPGPAIDASPEAPHDPPALPEEVDPSAHGLPQHPPDEQHADDKAKDEAKVEDEERPAHPTALRAPLQEELARHEDPEPAQRGASQEERAGQPEASDLRRDPAGPDVQTPDGPPTEEADPLERFEEAARGGDFALAYWYAVAARDEVRAQAARLLVLAMSTDMHDGSPHPRAAEIAATLGADMPDASRELRETVAAALVPAALILPPYSEATIALNAAAARLGDDCPVFIRVAVQLTYERGSGLHMVEAPLLLADRERARADLIMFSESASSRTIRYARATAIWRELVRQKGELGSLAQRILKDPRDADARDDLRRIEKQGIDRLIDQTDRQLNPGQSKRGAIIAGARQELTHNIAKYLELTRGLLAAEDSVAAIDLRTAHNTDLIEALIDAVVPASDDRESALSGAAEGVMQWLRERATRDDAGRPSLTAADLLSRPIAAAFEIERDQQGDVKADSVSVAVLDAVQHRSPEEAFLGFVQHHDYAGLDGWLSVLRGEGSSAVTALEERERRAKAESQEVLAREIERTRIALSRALSMTSLTDVEAQDYQDRVERLVDDTAPHYRESIGVLRDICAQLAGREQKRLDDASGRLASMTGLGDDVRARIEAVIAARDILSAEEFLAQLSDGESSLPEEDAEDRTLEEFQAVLREAEGAPVSGDWYAERLRAGSVADLPLPRPWAPQRLKDGLAAWQSLNRIPRPNGWEHMILDVLNGVGFQSVKFSHRFTMGRTSTSTLFDAKYDGYALTPTFGSAAHGQYALFVCWERKTVDGIIQAVRNAWETMPKPTIVLYFETLRAADRRLLAESCRRKGLSIALIDRAVMAYLGTREDVRLDALMHVCLPFSGSTPYTPFALGDVPREMFYGRRDELRLVQDPNGPLFVYGGRQLGKSALLKTAMSEYNKIDEHHVSLYLDLKAEGIGEWHRSDDLWRVLLPRLQGAGVIDPKTSPKAGADTAVSLISAWLDADERRHLLLLLDEADAFLDQDSQPRSNGRAEFKNVYRLKNLMTQSQRRFKPVFAGLHQVQRFHTQSNGPMAHVGTEIPVGPLPAAEAYKLVVRPMQAIGYRFESPDVVWRLLSHTNYQASLIQLFCQELVNDLKTARLRPGEPPSVIDGATVDRVYANRELRGQIAQRFDWTIQLDNRYRVIALVAAWLNLSGSEPVAAVAELQNHGEYFWPDGFAGISRDEFRALLDEMVGLGVLVRSSVDHYGIRSPNVIRLLGTRDEIERKLEDSSSLELRTVFDPSRYRRALEDKSRSPLTEAQAARMLVNAAEPTLIVASAALGAERLETALSEIADKGEPIDLYATTPERLTSTLTEVLRLRRPRHLFVDARQGDPEWLGATLDKLAELTRRQPSLTASVLIGAGQRRGLDLPEGTVREVLLKPWSDAELRAVEPEADVPLDADVRLALLDVTGGWPEVLEPALAFGRGADVQGMLDRSAAEARRVVDRGWAALAERIGVAPGGDDETVLQTLVDWDDAVSREDLSDLVPAMDVPRLTQAIADLVAVGALQPAKASSRAAAPTYRINPLVARTLQQGR